MPGRADGENPATRRRRQDTGRQAGPKSLALAALVVACPAVHGALLEEATSGLIRFSLEAAGGGMPGAGELSTSELRSETALWNIATAGAHEIKQGNQRTLLDTGRRVSGGYVRYDRTSGCLSSSGSNPSEDGNRHSQFLTDAGRAEDHHDDSILQRTEFPPDTDAIPRGGIANGIGLSVLGDNAFVGVINLITERGHDFQGAQFPQTGQRDPKSFDTESHPLRFPPRRTSWNSTLSNRGGLGILTNLIHSAAVRYNSLDTFGETVNPQIGLIVQPFSSTTVKLLYGKAFRDLRAYELYYAGYGREPDPDLGPEEVTTYQAVFERNLPHHLRFNATAYAYEITGLITQGLAVNTPFDRDDDALVYRRIPRITAQGLEAGLEGTHASGVRGRLALALQRVEDETTHGDLSDAPWQLARFSLMVPLYPDRLFSGWELQYLRGERTLGGNKADDCWIANLTLFSHKLVKGLEFSAGVYNLFAERSGSPGAGEYLQDVLPQAGRAFSFKLSYCF